ncbi:nitrilase-related carbon-nitrogen hydrolase [Reichenbachiella versicolor]|uniref:nitrilase-related carbon-nitrogen hydrolase n=1 Tax=Reichenbachiella versicolor TaxID=1821036 RepID=UPI000D6DC9AC|nr:nitrilase-related carbon-nitrogen hydrolase [Reichenbachiella versicolor]
MIADNLKVALVQTDIYWENVEANLNELEEKLWALEGNVDLIILPETFNTGFSINKSLAEVPGLKTQRWLLQIASQYKAVIGGSYLVNDKGLIYNRFVFAFPDGRIESYDKKHLFSMMGEEKIFKAGTQKLIVEHKGWRICPMICYDLRFPEWSRNKIIEGEYEYDLLVFIANWPSTRQNAWDSLLTARAIENQSYVLGVNRVGRDLNGLDYMGRSQVVDYQGEYIQSPYQETKIAIVEIQKQTLNDFRGKYPFLKDARL